MSIFAPYLRIYFLIMSCILNIETSTDVCSVAISDSGQVIFNQEDHTGPNHAVKLGVFVDEALDFLDSHGFGLVVHKFFSRQLGISIPRTLVGNSLSWLITYLYICFAWSFFRAKDLGVLRKMYDKVANDFSIDYLVPFFHARPAWTLCIIGVMLSYLFTERQYHRLQARFILLPWVAKLLLFIICLQMVVEVSQESVQPFIYYQF